MRDNFIKQQAAGLIMEALKTNRTITKMHFPIGDCPTNDILGFWLKHNSD
jgi:hypothetical protein